MFTVFLKYFSVIQCFLSELHSPYKADVDQGQLIYLIYLEDVFLFCPVLSNVFILIDMVVAARALAELRLVSVFARIPLFPTRHLNNFIGPFRYYFFLIFFSSFIMNISNMRRLFTES